jgi:hypothetical protein
MIPAGYMAKRVYSKSESLNFLRGTKVEDVYSLSGCISEFFTDYINFWKHNGYWLFDAPGIIRSIAREHSIDLEGAKLFYYEVHEQEFDGERWRTFAPEPSIPTNVTIPARKQLEGFDVATFFAGNAPECSPLSCNGLAAELPANAHCLFTTCEEAEAALSRSAFKDAEPGPYRIFAVYSVDWD